MDSAQPINLNLREKLKDKGYRQRFFRAQNSAQIADQLIALRKRRGLNQTQVAELSGTKQPAISRAEQADYQNRKLETLRAIVEALDGRLRVIIEPAEDVLAEYDDEKLETDTIAATQHATSTSSLASSLLQQSTAISTETRSKEQATHTILSAPVQAAGSRDRSTWRNSSYGDLQNIAILFGGLQRMASDTQAIIDNPGTSTVKQPQHVTAAQAIIKVIEAPSA